MSFYALLRPFKQAAMCSSNMNRWHCEMYCLYKTPLTFFSILFSFSGFHQKLVCWAPNVLALYSANLLDRLLMADVEKTGVNAVKIFRYIAGQDESGQRNLTMFYWKFAALAAQGNFPWFGSKVGMSKWGRTFSEFTEFRESEKSLKHELGSEESALFELFLCGTVVESLSHTQDLEILGSNPAIFLFNFNFFLTQFSEFSESI